MFKILKYFLESLIVYFFFLIGRLIGLKNSRKIFSFIFLNLGPLFKSTNIINNNLKKFSKNLSVEKKKIIINKMWSNYGMTFIEYIFLDIFRKGKKFVNFEGENILSNVLKEKKPVIFISGHFANFEIMSMEITKKKINLATIYRPLNNLFLNPFMELLRKKYVCKNQIRKGRSGVRDAIHFLNRGFSIALMIDQRVSEGESINLFNHPALTTTLPAQLALKYDIKIIPVSIERLNQSGFKITFNKPVDSKKFNNKYEITSYLNKELEKMIIKNANEWIWTHNRWKL